MCQTCGCANTDKTGNIGTDARTLEVMAGLLSANDKQAARNRDAFGRHGILTINLMSSPGAGKTSLLEATAALIPDDLRVAVIEGDLATENDADRVRRAGLEAVQITTGSACHLDAAMVTGALDDLDLHAMDVLFIENVGNLVCPASFDLGQHFNVTLLSIPEGDDKPLKYPVMFRAADLVLLTKTDLAPHIPDFDPQRAREYLQRIASPARCFDLSSRTGEGMPAWLDWLTSGLQLHRRDLAAGTNRRPHIERDAGTEAHDDL
jgi:hydrogenase nickel incorporation protein HypB